MENIKGAGGVLRTHRGGTEIGDLRVWNLLSFTSVEVESLATLPAEKILLGGGYYR